MENNSTILKVENVSKVYRLGEIGGTTLRDELQRLHARLHKKEDPTKRIGAKNYNKGEKFKALSNISFDIHKGERVGIIGHNGAGKSTLLKLISRVTGPTEGSIGLNGRVASMLEVGTGFHPELTGRENVYMNGAILGMTKKEIDRKIEEIIEFSEVRQFIDTPVKRYSSGMYVKLAFAVAAHLDSEIMIMDEVLAVGDATFQQKCLTKMKDLSLKEDKTLLYVSHNMSTIRQLCNRVIVLNKGSIIYDGDVEKGIEFYMGVMKPATHYEFDDSLREPWWVDRKFQFTSLDILGKKEALFDPGEQVKARVFFKLETPIEKLKFRFEISDGNGTKIGTAFSDFISSESQKKGFVDLVFKTDILTPGRYYFDLLSFIVNDYESTISYDGIFPAMNIEISLNTNKTLPYLWKGKYFGDIHFPDIEILQ